MAEEKSNEVKASEVKTISPAVKSYWQGHRSGLMVAGLALVFLALLCAAFALGRHGGDRFERGENMRGMSRAQSGFESSRSGGHSGMMGGGMEGPRGGAVGPENTASSTHVRGVVTAVDGDTLTVAGNGTTTKVAVNANTTYTGSDKPAKVNDTIMVMGARQTDGTLLASTVRLSRQ